MPKTNLWCHLFSLLFLAPSLGLAETRWIFPGQTLPPEIPYVPLRTGASGGEDVQVQPRDWFLLKKPGLIVSTKSQVPGQIRDFYGPTLNDSNAQVYFRLVSGMILKETMVQMGMKPIQARLLMERIAQSGRVFDSVPLNELGELPRGLDDLYDRWDRPMARMAIIPYLLLPLATANNESSFLHFYTANISNENQDKKCSTITSAAPLSTVQNKIVERQKKLETLATNVRQNADLAEQAAQEIDRLTAKIKTMSNEIDERSQCVDSIRDRVTRGAAMPTPACLEKAKAVLDESNQAAEWNKFVTVNLANAKGDYSVRQELDLGLKILESRLQGSRQSFASMKEKRAKTANDQVQNEDKLSKLQNDRKAQAALEANLEEEERTLKQELDRLQTIRFKLELGTLAQEVSEAELQKTIKATPERNLRVEAIKARLPAILVAKGKLQANAGAITTQFDFLKRAIDDNQAQIRSLDAQIGSEKSGAAAEVADLEKTTAAANTKYLQASDTYNFADNIISALSRKLITLTPLRDAEMAALRREEATAANLKTALNSAAVAKQNNWEGLQKEITSLEGQLTNYRGDDHMGWFLELDCSVREQLEAGNAGVFISRSQFAGRFSPAKADESPVDGGKWGLFNMDYGHFRTAIEGGILLNLNDYIRLSVQHAIKNLDYAIAQYMDPVATRCGAASAFNTAALDLMGTAFAIWNEGSDDQAKTKIVCKPTDAKVHFAATLARFLEFGGGVLDQALPRTNSDDGNGQNERQAITALTLEMRTLSGKAPEDKADANRRRENLVRALIKILAYDYDKAIGKSQEFQAAQDVRLAGAAPGKEISAESAAKLVAGGTQAAQETTRAYRAPIAKPEFDLGVAINKNDQVRLLAIENSGAEVTRAGWARIQVLDKNSQPREGQFWIAASTLAAPTPIREASRPTVEVKPGTPPSAVTAAAGSNCSLRRLVVSMHGTQLARVVPEIKIWPAQTENYWRVNLKDSGKASPAFKEKTYVACEVYSQPGKAAMIGVPASWRNQNGVDLSQALAIRIVEVRREEAGGSVKYVPVEDYGGFVTAWIFNSESATPRLALGPQLDAQTWSVVQ